MSGRAQRAPESLAREGLSRGTSWHSSTSSSSPFFFGSQGQRTYVPLEWACSSPHSTKKGWLLPNPVPHWGAEGAGMTPLPTAHGCRQGAGRYSTRGITPCCHPKTPSTKTPSAGLPRRGCSAWSTPQQPHAPQNGAHFLGSALAL